MATIARIVDGRIVTTTTQCPHGDGAPERSDRDDDTLCWHCCFPFDTDPIPLPYKWDEKRNTFSVCGAFCSFACMNGYSRDRGRLHSTKNCGMSIFQLYKQMTGNRSPPPSAPPRNFLRAFGGHMTIQEFRASSEQVDYIEMPKNCTIHASLYLETPQPLGPKQIRSGVNSFVNATTRDTGIRIASEQPTIPRGSGYTAASRKKTMLELALGM